MEEVLEKCFESSDNESYDSSSEDLFIVGSSKLVNDSWKDGYSDGAMSMSTSTSTISSETRTSSAQSLLDVLKACTNFKRTHCFLLQAWEALYWQMLNAYMYILVTNEDFPKNAKCILFTGISEERLPQDIMERIATLMEDNNTSSKLMQFISEMSQKDDTWRFWYQFVFKDCYSYLSLYLAIRSSNWKLGIDSLIKKMAPVFTAFDCDFYERIIPHHLADIQQFPPIVLSCLATGGFTVRITGQRRSAVALDEAQEMCINKDLKSAIVRPTGTKVYLQKTALFFNYRIKAYRTLIHQLFPERFISHIQTNNITDSTPQAHHREENIKEMSSLIQTNKLLCIQSTKRGILNVFSGQKLLKNKLLICLLFVQLANKHFKNM